MKHFCKDKGALAGIMLLTLLVALYRLAYTSRSLLPEVTINAAETLSSLSLPPIPENDGKYPITNIALLGQFNYDVPVRQVENWVQIWSRYFSSVSVVGPFSEQTYRTLRQVGVHTYLGADDRGFVSPVQNVVDALERASPEIDAVLYVHDDGLLNLTKFFQGQSEIPTDKFIGNLQHVPDRSYSISVPASSSSSQSQLLRRNARKQNGKITYDIPSHNSTPTSDRKKFLHALPKWKWKEQCLEQQLNMLTRANSQVVEFSANYYHAHHDSQEEAELQYFFASNGQMDFLLIPTIHKELFVRIAGFFIQDKVFLECAFPTIVLWVLQEATRRRVRPTIDKRTNADDEDHDISRKDNHHGRRSLVANQGYAAHPEVLTQQTTYLPVCTSWNKRKRGTPEVLEECLQDSSEYGMYHPVKLSSYSADEYALWLDRLQKPH